MEITLLLKCDVERTIALKSFWVKVKGVDFAEQIHCFE